MISYFDGLKVKSKNFDNLKKGGGSIYIFIIVCNTPE